MSPDNLPPYLAEQMRSKEWIIIGVPQIGITYSVGLTVKFNHPELVIHGLDCSIAYDLIHNMVRKINEGVKYRPGQDFNEIANDYPARFIKVHDANKPTWMGVAYRANRRQSFDALQMVMCDKERRFPWESGCELNGVQIMFDKPVKYEE